MSSSQPVVPPQGSDAALDALAEPVAPAPEPPRQDLTPWQWARANLFSSWFNGLVTVVFALVAISIVYRIAYWVLVTAEWTIVRVNLRLFMVGRFPEDELWRLWTSIYVLAATIGLAIGVLARAAALPEAPAEERRSPAATAVGALHRFWPLVLAVVAVLALTRTVLPTLLAVGLVPVLVLARLAGTKLQPGTHVWFVVVSAGMVTAGGAVGFWLLSSVIGLPDVVGMVGAAVLVAATVVQLHRVRQGLGAGWLWLLVAVGLMASFLVVVIGDTGVTWDDWGGIHLTIFATVAGIALAFPLGVVLAIARYSSPMGAATTTRGLLLVIPVAVLLVAVALSGLLAVGWVAVLLAVAVLLGMMVAARDQPSLPGIRLVSVAYIETFRAVPLVTLLFMGQHVIRFAYPTWAEPPSFLARAIIAITVFQAAYIAEIVRGGLQSIPRGQVEAAQAIGLPPTRVMRLVVLPQALRAVIPAMVGQFISLFKDTSLLALIGFFELLDVAETVTKQDAFRGQGLHVVTLTFVGFLYWAGCSTMSRESRRLEQRLGVGVR